MELQEIQVDNDENQENSKSPTKAEDEKNSTSSVQLHSKLNLTEQATHLTADQEIQDSQLASSELEDLNKEIETTLDDIKTWLQAP